MEESEVKIKIFLPENPTVTSQEKGFNRYTGQFYTKTEVMALKNTYHFEIRRALAINKVATPKFKGPVRLKVIFTFSTSTKRTWGMFKTTKPDCDNCVKALQDVLGDMGFFEVGDQQVCDLQVIKKWGDKPSVEIEIEEVTNDSDRI
jgi:Holliday junction resolvase RusA-like endonuclease